jgi:hopanoid biosynthesis associated RND transporter like protein HpnN
MKPEQFHSREASFVHRLLLGLVGGVCRCPRLVLAVSVLVALGSTYAFYHFLEYRTSRSDLINPNKDSQQRWRQYVAEFGNDEDMVVVVQGTDQQRMQQALEHVAAQLREQPALFDRLFYKVDLRLLQNRALLYLPTEQIQQIQTNIKSMSVLLELGPISWQQLTLSSLLHEARTRGDEQFLTQLLAISRSATATLAHPENYRNPWRSLMPPAPEQQNLLAEPQYFFSGDGSLAFLLARPIQEQGSFTAAKKSVDALRAILAETRTAYPELALGLTGLPVLENDEMAAAQDDTRMASLLAIAGVTLLFVVVYRGIWYPLLTVATLLIGTAWAMGWLTLTVGHLNILSATFAVMLIGMGDYGVLWVMRYEQARRQGAEVRAAILHTVTHVAMGNLTAATTLALAFFAAMLADFQAVTELGWIAGCGVLLCALACFTVLPALLMLFDRRQELGSFSIPLVNHAAWLPAFTGGRSRRVVGTGLVLTAIMAVCIFRLGYDHNLLHLQARDLDSVKWELTLIEHTAGASWHAVSYTDSPQEALALKARYEQLPEVSRVVEVASLVPRDQDAKLEMLRDIQHRLRNLPRRGAPILHPCPDISLIQSELGHLVQRLQHLAHYADLRLGFQELRDQIGKMPNERVAAQGLQEFEQRIAGDLAEDLHRLRDVSTPATIAIADMPVELRERYIGQSGKWLLRVFAKDCLWDFEPLEHFTRQIAEVDPSATGKPFSTVEGLKAMKNGFQWAGLYALIVIVLVLVADFRTPRNTLIALTPLAMGVVLSLGIMGWCGLPLNPANMIAFPLILGVGVDNGVHMLHDWLLRRAEGRSTISYAIGRGVLVKALTTMIGFGTLMISSERGLASLGFILTLGVGCCLCTALVFLPAALALMSKRSRANIQLQSEPLREAA